MDDVIRFMFHSPHMRQRSGLTMAVIRYVVAQPDYKDGIYILPAKALDKPRTRTNSLNYVRNSLGRGNDGST